jgi:hypothetical protein
MNSSKRRTVREAAANGSKREEGSPWHPRLTDRSKELDAAVAAGQSDAQALIWSEFPAWLRKGSEGQELALTRLMADALVVDANLAATVQDVVDARALGASWQHVGMALGISAEGARSRYGRPARRRGGQDELLDTS